MLNLIVGTVLASVSFLGFNSNSTLLDVTNRFNSPVSVENTETTNYQKFVYLRDAYAAIAVCDNKGKLYELSAVGLNKSVNYKGVRLCDTFKNVIVKMGNPDSFQIDEDHVIVNYKDVSFNLAKYRKNVYQVFSIEVKFNQNTMK